MCTFRLQATHLPSLCVLLALLPFAAGGGSYAYVDVFANSSLGLRTALEGAGLDWPAVRRIVLTASISLQGEDWQMLLPLQLGHDVLVTGGLASRGVALDFAGLQGIISLQPNVTLRLDNLQLLNHQPPSSLHWGMWVMRPLAPSPGGLVAWTNVVSWQDASHGNISATAQFLWGAPYADLPTADPFFGAPWVRARIGADGPANSSRAQYMEANSSACSPDNSTGDWCTQQVGVPRCREGGGHGQGGTQ